MKISCAISFPSKENDSVGQWLSELRFMTEIECMSILQGKPLAKEDHISDPSYIVRSLKGLLMRCSPNI